MQSPRVGEGMRIIIISTQAWCPHGTFVVLGRPCPSNLNAHGNPIPMNAQQSCAFNDDRYDNIALPLFPFGKYKPRT